MALQTSLHFSRYEFKYMLSPTLRREVERELEFFMELDAYVATKPEKKYTVRSLYFDNPMFTHFHDKIDGQLTRSKFRLRTYTTACDEGCAVFLEIKGRHNNLVFKHRAPLESTQAPLFRIDDREILGKTLRLTQASQVLERFRFDLERRLIEPVMLVDYLRRPYVSKFDPEFRVTFDDELRARATATLFPSEAVPSRAVLLGQTVLEVKFRYHVPSWFHRIIQSYELQRVSISKICKGIETFGLAPALD